MRLPPPIPLALDRDDACLSEVGLWLDPHRPREFAFLSHAHADHVAAHRRILCSAATRKLLEVRFGMAAGAEFLSPGFEEAVPLREGWTAELLPAGHIAGSAMLLLRREADGATLLHTGDFKTRPAMGAESVAPRKADSLIMETTFGLPKFRFPPAEEVLASIVKWCREGIEEGEIPVLMAYSLGKAQELLLSLARLAPEFTFQVHDSVEKMNGVVASLGYPIPPCAGFAPQERSPHGAVVIVPPTAGRSLAIRRLRKTVRLGMVSGWGMEPGAKYRYQCDEVFPLSDHAGYDDLIAFVEAVDPVRVHTIHGYTTEFAADLRRRGREAWPLFGDTQMEFDGLTKQTGSGDGTDSLASLATMDDRPDPASEFGAFTLLCRDTSGATGKGSKRVLLANYLTALEGGRLPVAVRFLEGRPLPPEEGRRTLSLGWAAIRQAVLEVSGLSLVRFRQMSSAQGDAARSAALAVQGHTRPVPKTLEEVAGSIVELAFEPGQSARIRRLRDFLMELHPAEVAVLVGILLGDLRIGLKEGLLEEAIAEAFRQDLEAVRGANLLLGDLAETARLAREDKLALAGATWFTPLRVMLASPAADAGEIVSRLGGNGPIWLEDKFDGIRAQLHRRGEEVSLYSRDLRPLDSEFPELIEAAKGLDRDVILDGEIIARAEGRRLGFHDLQKRLGRRDLRLDQGDLFFGGVVPVRFVAFDLLAVDGTACLGESLSERRERLESLTFPPGLECCEVFRAETEEDIDEAFNRARRRDNEGLIAKDPGSRYTPGRRGKAWLKLKKAMPTLDVVVVRAQQGHGKRAHVLSDYTFAVSDEESGTLRVIGKAYSGLTDLEIEELTGHFRERTVSKHRGVHDVVPDVVLEIAFDSIRPSSRHDSGLALRFPRIHAIRRDKTAAEIDTLAYARKLAGLEN